MCLQVQTDVRKYWYTQPTDLHFLKPEIHKCNRCGITSVPMHSNDTSSGTHKCTNALAEQWLPHHACPVDTVAGSTRIQTLCCHRLWELAGFIFEDFNNFIQLYFILCVLSLIIDGAPFSKILFLLGHHSMFMDRCCQTRSRHQTRIKTE